ncbi:reverse transcriptase domain-containing protein [Brucella sp. MAB-22]|uniref:reverse transcriptase domain-containing protein n=1 Tax=Brucella TaxID=234 RepID=UPI000F679573|nr:MULTISPECIES: reverse transcriptase domain-containing protein [Brucella]RRY19017.1 Reverse transcriptase [Brucella anthropi]UYT53942.1 reverse transcriptase domain-containing protein [Brucella sp. MAB-22]
MGHEWFKTRGYRHFDAPVGPSYAAKVDSSKFVAKHSWLPLIHYVKRVKRYKAKDGKTVYKDRDIMFASHRDACILAKYAFDLSVLLDQHYIKSALSNHVIAYRKLGRGNYDFSADAYRFAQKHEPCVVLCFDITGFFDNLDHTILKNRLKRLLGVDELPPDWYAVFRHVTKFHKVERQELEAHPVFSTRIKGDTREPIATITELHKAGIVITPNPNKFGIPQGTPISSAFSNLYMMDVDAAMVTACGKIRALYQRYSDDILIVCRPDNETEIIDALKSVIIAHKLEIKDEKTERALFGSGSEDIFQYLGFNVSKDGAVIRPTSLARQWRKARRAIKTTKRIGEQAIAKGNADKIYTKRLRKRFAPVGARNFSKYARRAADAFGSKRIVRQVMRLERMVDQAIRDMDK